VAIADEKRSALAVPYAIEPEFPDRVPKERYFDAAFYQLEVERLWPRVWQMACRLEEIPQPHDVVEYEFLDQSVMVLRTDDLGVRAFQNTCRHRGVRLVQGRGSCPDGFTCPFHGWCYGTDGANKGIPRRKSFAAHNVEPGDVDLVPVRCEIWGGCAWVNFDGDAPPVRECMEPAATILDAWKVEAMRTEQWFAVRLPVNWKLAIEAFVEMYHVVVTHPQLAIPGMRYSLRPGAPFDPRGFIDAEIEYLRVMSEGMDGMVHRNDVHVAEDLRGMELPADPALAVSTWNRSLNDAVMHWNRERGAVMPDLNELDEHGFNDTFYTCFPHYFVLPMYSGASSYRFRPLGPEETLMEIWSMARFPEGDEPDVPTRPEVWEPSDGRWPPIPGQDFSNLPRQQKGLHAAGFEYMRLSESLEGTISNMERTIDGFLAGLPYEMLLPALHKVNVAPFDKPVLDLGF
jgi:phenylpropionate dioxygenase-like ring-hydroxylating dioxygenase large terminal subunit